VGAHVLEVRRGRRSARASFGNQADDSLIVGRQVAAGYLARHDLRRLEWQWGEGVLLYGLLRFAQSLPAGDPERAATLDAIEGFHQEHATRGRPGIDYPDRCSPALSALGLARDEGRPAALPGAVDVADYLRTERRNALGTIDHLGSRSRMRKLANLAQVLRYVLPFLGPSIGNWARSIWVDSLMMYALFSAQWGRHAGDPNLEDFGLRQPGLFADVLQDPRTGLFHHGWDVPHRRTLGAVWLRGNGWVIATCVEMLEQTPPGHPARARLEGIVRDQAQGLLARQGPSGLWGTLLEDDRSYLEASGSALVAFGLAKGARLGVLGPDARDAARRAFRALVARLEPASGGPALTGTSTATNALPAWTYELIPRKADVDYGVGAFLLLAAELKGERWR